MPEGSEFGIEYDFFKFPASKNPDAMVGIGDILVALNNNSNSLIIFEKLISNQFGKVLGCLMKTLHTCQQI